MLQKCNKLKKFFKNNLNIYLIAFIDIIIEKNNCGICVDPFSPTEIRNAIDYLLSNPNLAEQMGENGKNLVKKQYNWSIEETKLISFYYQILEN